MAARGKKAVPGIDTLASRHARLGWWSLLVFVLLGLVLEGMHGLKVQWYLSLAHETRRHLWTLAHAHGTLLALVNLVFAFGLSRLSSPGLASLRLASGFLVAATVLLPLGFLLGGLIILAGDPGPGILLVPAGALCLAAAVFLTARAQD